MKVLTASSISDAIKKTTRFIDDWAYHPPYCWFRGIKNSKLTLQPGACWRSRYTEFDTLVDFVQRGVAFGDMGALNNWNTYYLAQHHAIPTRLLDWTESFTAALFFAFDGWNGRTTPTVWILQPYLLNETFLGWYGIIEPENYDECSIWLPKQVNQNTHLAVQDEDGNVFDNHWPIAIYPKHTNRRITAQQGMFTVHGRDQRSLDVLIAERGGAVEDHLARIDLKGFRKADVFSEFAMLGIRRSAIYPDMDSFVKELKERSNW